MVFPTLGYHAERGLTLKFTILQLLIGRTTAQRVVREYAGGERFRRLFDGSCTEAT